MQPNKSMLTPANARAARASAKDDIEWWSAFFRWANTAQDKGTMSEAQYYANLQIMEKVYEESISRRRAA